MHLPVKTMPPEEAARIRDAWRADLTVGTRARFDDGLGDTRRWWTVRATSDRFAILTRQAAFEPKGVLCYTIIDWELGFRGPCNQIGQGWGDGTFADEECAALLAALEVDEVEVSWRNRVPIRPGQTIAAATAGEHALEVDR
ncbi:hypothetical protein [Nocardioides sp.]|uniref:hypothetical protein n=1 Tax=Nocardioides sp. TaxID=35761 RepID=UPI0026330AD6|nr:hypothetical protein [Nocardioides sp.]MDI6911498.1 hypothetical protein [Nocardioides sp.]